MTIHNFTSDFSVRQEYRSNLPFQVNEIPSVRQNSHHEGGKISPFNDRQEYPDHVEEHVIPGFRALDEAMKQYWSGIKIPTKDAYRYLRVKVAGGDKSILIWADDLKEGKARLPVASLSREGHEFYPEKFSPKYHPMSIRYLSTRGDMVAQVFRPLPFLVDYKLFIWTEHKRDAEYALYQILTRFCPLAVFRIDMANLSGDITLRFGGAVDASDKEVGFDQNAAVKYEVSMTAEAFLPLPEVISKTVLGMPKVVKEQTSNNSITPLEVSIGRSMPSWANVVTDILKARIELNGDGNG